MRIVIGDFDYDYNLWRYALSDDHDMREMLTADYFLAPTADGGVARRTDVIAKPDPNAIAGGQPLPVERRAGLLTTQWFLAYNTMFSSLPRVTAAQAYRAYLGADIASGATPCTAAWTRAPASRTASTPTPASPCPAHT